MTRDLSCLLPIPVPPPKEGSHFKFPPLNGTFTIPQLYDWHLIHNANHPVFMYKQIGSSKTIQLTYSKVVPAIHRAGNLILAAINSGTSPGPVAIAATSGKSGVHICFFQTENLHRYNHIFLHSRRDVKSRGACCSNFCDQFCPRNSTSVIRNSCYAYPCE